MTVRLNEERHLGDGLFVSFDGYQFRLRAPRDNGDHEVFLEPGVHAEYLRFTEEALKP